MGIFLSSHYISFSYVILRPFCINLLDCYYSLVWNKRRWHCHITARDILWNVSLCDSNSITEVRQIDRHTDRQAHRQTDRHRPDKSSSNIVNCCSPASDVNVSLFGKVPPADLRSIGGVIAATMNFWCLLEFDASLDLIRAFRAALSNVRLAKPLPTYATADLSVQPDCTSA